MPRTLAFCVSHRHLTNDMTENWWQEEALKDGGFWLERGECENTSDDVPLHENLA